MGNLGEELQEIKIKKSFDRYLRTKVLQLSDLLAEEKTEQALLLLQSCYKDGYDEGYFDAVGEFK